MKKLNVISVQNRLLALKIRVFSVADFARIFEVQPVTAQAFLSFNSRKGLFTKITRGIYAFVLNPPDKFETANYLYKPSYISFETALSYHGIIPETVYTITSATTKPFKEFNVQEQSYQYRHIKKELFFGYTPTRTRGKILLIADKEKALLDYLYFSSLKKQPLNERIDLSKIDKQKFGKYFNYLKRSVRKNEAVIAFIKKVNL